MDRIGFVLVIVLATAGYSAAVNQPTDCDDPVICLGEKPDDYHLYQDNMNKIIKQNKHLTEAQNLDNLGDFESGEEKVSGDEENCLAVTTVKQPFVIQTNGSSDIVVQLQNFEQKIKWTECHQNSPKKQPCFGSVFTAGISEVEAQCGEKYGAVSLYIYDPNDNEVQYKMFEVPVACACRFKSKDE